MAVTPGLYLAAGFLLGFSGLHCSSVQTGCPEPCTCQSASLVNCSSSGLTLVPQRIQDSIADLDLSHNLLDSVTFRHPYLSLKNVWLGNNRITRLSLCIERYLGARKRNTHGSRSWSRRGCVLWAPTLQMLSVESNQLDQLPEGLEGSESLQVLRLSFNKISALRPGDLRLLPQLIELHLQHNLITSLHPQTFQSLAKLQFLDLSFNKLTSLHPVMYRSLRNLPADVRLGGNRWQCDCTMRVLRRWMTYDSSRGLQAWRVVCASPSVVSGRDLLQLEEDDLNCFSSEHRPELHHDVTVYSGSEILLSCSSQDSMWWPPGGRAPVRQPPAGLVIADITERDAGLYVCVSEEHKVVSVFNLQISKVENARRKTRRFFRSSQQIIPNGSPSTIGEEKRNQTATESDLALAVCLSVFITFLVAFILGVLARPCINVLWRRVTAKKRSSETNPVSSVEQRQYDNEAYSNGEEPEVIHRERRVTFSTVEIRETSNVQYYDTVASGEQQSINNDVVIECEAAKAEKDTCTAGDSGGEKSLRQSSSEKNQEDVRELSGVPDAGCPHKVQFKHIPDPAEPEKRSLSSCSDSSLSDQVCTEDQMTQRKRTKPKSAQLVEDSIQQGADFWTGTEIEDQQISTEDSEIPGFSSEPFADWSPLTKNPNLTDPDLWQDSEEQFEFSDSVQSVSERSNSVGGFLSNSKLAVSPASDKQKRDDTSSSSSSVADDEPTEYTVNYDQEEEVLERNLSDAFLKPDAGFHGVDSIMPSVGFNQIDYRYETQSHAVRPERSFSSHSSDSDGEDHTVKQETDKGERKDESVCVFDKSSSSIVKPMPRTKWQVLTLGVTSQGRSLDTGAPSPPAAYSPSSSSDSDAEFKYLKADLNTVRLTDGIKIDEQETLSTNLDRQCTPRIKSHLNIRVPLSSSNPSSSDESMDETTKHTKREEQGDVDMTVPPVKVSQSARNNARKPQWPSLDRGHVIPSKTALVVKGPSPTTDSSSSDGETSNHINSAQGQMHEARLPIEASLTVNDDPQTQWSALDLEHSTPINRHEDIKPASPDHDSSSSSDSEEQTTGLTEKKRPVKVGVEVLETEALQTKSIDPDKKWPVLDLEHSTRIKRRLDIKSPSPDSSSSSDSEDGTTGHIEKHWRSKVDTDILETEVLQTKSHDLDKKWPVLNLEHITRIKRRLDIKPLSPDSGSSSSSDSEHETTGHIDKQRPVKVGVAGFPFQESQTESPGERWPLLDLEHSTLIKRRLDIKPPSPDSGSSSSSDSEDETTGHLEKHWTSKVDTDILETEVLQTKRHDQENRWPILDLEHTTRIKRRLDIKPPSPDSGSSSSSDSEHETAGHIEKQRPVKVGVARFPFQESQSESPGERWPLLDLEHSTRIKRRLDIKPPSPDSDSTSSSDSEDETTGLKEKKRLDKVDIEVNETEVLQTKSHDPDKKWPVLNLEHITRIKRRLDIKPSTPDSDSSSSSDSEDETTGHIEKHWQGKVGVAGFPFQESQTESPGERWPVLDLEHSKRIKRRLDIKSPSPDSGSSSSSDSEDETTGHIEKHWQGKVDIAGIQFQDSPIESTEGRWPILDLGHTTRIKRRLDIKSTSPNNDSSSSSDSENETTGHIEKHWTSKVDTDILETEVQQTKSHDPDNRWPVLDLEHTTRIKRRLDIKPPSPVSHLCPRSDSEEETTNKGGKQRPVKVGITGLPFQGSQTECLDPDNRWPALDLEHTIRIKRRLDIKSPSPDSSSSSDSEDGTTNQIKKQGQRETAMPRHPTKVSQTVSHEPPTQWPALNLEDTTRIKRRLDIKPASPDSDSSSSGDREDEKTHHTERETRNIGNIHVKRRLEVKVVSSPAAEAKRKEASEINSHSSSGSYEEEEITEDVHIPPITVEPDPMSRWPKLGPSSAPRVRRCLDIRAPSPSSSSSSGESEGKTTGQSKREERARSDVETTSHQHGTKLPDLKMSVPLIKRRMNINAPTQPADSCSPNRDNGSRVSSHTVKHETNEEDVGMGKQTKMSKDVLYISRRLHVKAPQPDPTVGIVTPGSQSESYSSTSDSEDEKGDRPQPPLGASALKATEKEFIRTQKTPMRHFYRGPKRDPDIKLEKYTALTDDMGDKTTRDIIDTTPEINPELESRWATMNLGISRFRKRLEITSPPHETPNLPSTPPPGSPFSSSSDKGTASTGGRMRRKRRDVATEGILLNKSSPMAENQPVNLSLTLKGKDSGNSVEVEERLERDYSLPKAEEKSNSDAVLTGLGAPHFSKYLDIKVSERAPATPPSQQLHDSSSSSDNEDVSTQYVGRGWTGGFQRSAVTNKEASLIQTSVYMSQSIDAKLDQSQSQTVEEERRAAVELKSKTTNVGVETHWSPTYIPQIRRALDIRAPSQRETSSGSSSSEDETKDHRVPDLSLGVPRVKRGLNVKAPVPGQSNSSSSSSGSENEATEEDGANPSRRESDESKMTGDTPIAYYKRSIFQASLSQSSYFSHSGSTIIDQTNERHTRAETATVADGSPSHGVGGGDASVPTVRVPSMGFDNVVKKRIELPTRATDMDMPSEIKWTGIGHQRTDRSISRARTHPDAGLSTSQQEPSAQTPDSSNYSRGESEYKIEQDGGKADGTRMQTRSSGSDSGVNRASSRARDKSENSAGRASETLGASPDDVRARKGLSALKAMSSERRRWDSQASHLEEAASPLFVDRGPKVETSFIYLRSEDTEPPSPQPRLHLSSPSVDDGGSTDPLYGIPRYRRHDFGRIEPSQEAPPPIPATPPPDESEGLTWRSPQTEQSRRIPDSDPSNTSQNLAVYFDSPNINISHV